MKEAVTKVWSVVEIYMKAVSFLLAVFCIFSIAAPRASAAQPLTGTQVAAVATLLASMNVDQATIAKVATDLTESPSYAAPSSNAAAAVMAQPLGLLNLIYPTTTSAVPVTLLPWLPATTTAGSGAVLCQNGVCASAPGTPVPLPNKPAPVPTSTLSTPMPAPVCTLTADKTSLGKKGGQVTISWNTQNATEVSAPGGGKSKQLTGSLSEYVRETTIFVKKAYGPGGTATCSALIKVEGDNTPTNKLASNVLGAFSDTLSDMQAGAAVIGEASINLLFGF